MPRFTIRQLMIAVGVAALGCASVPFLVADPVATLVVAALGSAILAVVGRGRNKVILVGALSLAGLATLVFTSREARTIWRDAALHRRTANRHADRRDRILANLPHFDRQHRTVTGPALDQYKDRRKTWVNYSEYDPRTVAKYDRAARRPWLRVEPEPEPDRDPGFDPLLILQSLQ